MTFLRKIMMSASMLTLGIGIPFYFKYQQKAVMQYPLATSLATQGEVSDQSIININNNAELHDLIAQSMTKPLVVKIMRNGCGACQQVLNNYAITASNFQDAITFGEIDYDRFEGKESLDINVVPTYFYYKNGKRTMKLHGVRSREQFSSDMHRLLETN